jgi:hypothetical protein
MDRADAIRLLQALAAAGMDTRAPRTNRLRKGTPTEQHLKLVLSVIDGPRFPEKDE